eukprot:5702337-Prymnesium_polylepis.1
MAEDVHIGPQRAHARSKEERAAGLGQRGQQQEALLEQQLVPRQEVRECDEWLARRPLSEA